jgi:hypothetical protein
MVCCLFLCGRVVFDKCGLVASGKPIGHGKHLEKEEGVHEWQSAILIDASGSPHCEESDSERTLRFIRNLV